MDLGVADRTAHGPSRLRRSFHRYQGVGYRIVPPVGRVGDPVPAESESRHRLF